MPRIGSMALTQDIPYLEWYVPQLFFRFLRKVYAKAADFGRDFESVERGQISSSTLDQKS